MTIRHAAGQRLVDELARLLLGFGPVQDHLARNISETQINYRGGGYVSPFYAERAGRGASMLPGDHAPRAPHLQTVPGAGGCGYTT